MNQSSNLSTIRGWNKNLHFDLIVFPLTSAGSPKDFSSDQQQQAESRKNVVVQRSQPAKKLSQTGTRYLTGDVELPILKWSQRVCYTAHELFMCSLHQSRLIRTFHLTLTLVEAFILILSCRSRSFITAGLRGNWIDANWFRQPELRLIIGIT